MLENENEENEENESDMIESIEGINKKEIKEKEENENKLKDLKGEEKEVKEVKEGKERSEIGSEGSEGDIIESIDNKSNEILSLNENKFIITPSTPSSTLLSNNNKDNIFQKLKKRLPVFKPPRIKLLGSQKISDSGSLSSLNLSPPVPDNYPSTEEFLIRIEYRKQRHNYGMQKVEYYLQVKKKYFIYFYFYLSLTLYILASSRK